MQRRKLNRDLFTFTNLDSGLVLNRQIIKRRFDQIGHLDHQENGGGRSVNGVNNGSSMNNSKSSIFSRLGPIPNRGEKSVHEADANFNTITHSPSLVKNIQNGSLNGHINGSGQASLPQRLNFLKVNEPSSPPTLPKFLSFKIQISNPDAKPPPPQLTSPVKNNVVQNDHNSSYDSTTNEIDNNDSDSENESESENVFEYLDTSQQSQIKDDEEQEDLENSDEVSQMEEQEISLTEEDCVDEEEEVEYEIIEEEIEIDEEIEDSSSEDQNLSPPPPIKSKIHAPVEPERTKMPISKNTEIPRLKSKIVEIKWDQPKELERSQDKIPKQNMKKGNELPKNKNLEQEKKTCVKVKSVIKTSPIKLPSTSKIERSKSKISSLYKGKRSTFEIERNFLKRDSDTESFKRNSTSSTKSFRSNSNKSQKCHNDNNLSKTQTPPVRPSTHRQQQQHKKELIPGKLSLRKSKEDIRIRTRPTPIKLSQDRKNDIKDKIKNIFKIDRSLVKLNKNEHQSVCNSRRLKYPSYRNSSVSKVKTDEPSSSSSGSSRTSTSRKSKNNDNYRRSRARESEDEKREDLKRSPVSISKYSSLKIARNERIRYNEDKSPSEGDRNRSNRKSLIDIDRVYDTYRKAETSPIKRNTIIERTSNNNNNKSPIKFSQTREILTNDITKKDRTSLFEKFGILLTDDEKYNKKEEVSLIRRRRVSDEDKPKQNLIAFVTAGKSQVDEVKAKIFKDDDIDQMINLDNYGNVARNIVLKMGFKPGQGLGKQGQGIIIPIEMDKKPAKKIRRDGIL